MKKINSILLALVSVFALTWTACTDSVDYIAAGAVEGEGLYFSNTESTTINLEGTEGSFTVNVYRSNAGAATQAAVNVQFAEDAASLFTAPSTVNFSDQSAVASLTVSYSNIVQGTKYTMSISVNENEASPYGISSQTYTIVYPEDEGNWEVVSNEAVYTENMFSMYGAANIRITGVTVEKNLEANQYRFKSPYNNAYFQSLYGISLFGANFEVPYIVLDGEKYKNEAPGMYYIAPTALGFQMVNGEGPKVDETWETFGSVAGNLSTSDGPIPPTSSNYPLVSYDERTKKFDFGSLFHNLGGYGYYLVEGFTLYLDPDLMTVDYDRDYTWYEVYQGSGTFVTTITGEPQGWYQPIQRAAEDATLYRLPSLYSYNNALYFNLNEENGLLVLPKSQKTGLTTNIGNQEIYVSGVPGQCTYDAETKTFNLVLSLHLIDADGNTTAELAQVTETFMWGNGVFSEFVPNKKLSDYAGSWNVSFFDSQSGGLLLPVATNVLKDENGGEYLFVSGLSGISEQGYKDDAQLYYDQESGYVVFIAQNMPELEGYPTLVVPFDSENGYLSTTAELVGGLTEDGNLKFVSSLMNDANYNSICYLVSMDEGFAFLTGYWAGLDWTKATDTTTRSIVPGITFEDGFKPFAQKKANPATKRNYLKSLDLTPVPVSNKTGNTILDNMKTNNVLFMNNK